MHAASVVALGVLVGCADDPAPTDGPCWPIESVVGGELQLGTGETEFMPLPDRLSIQPPNLGSHQLEPQLDPYLLLNVRMRGLPPGDAENLFDPNNPRTKWTVTIGAIGRTLTNECPMRLGFRAAADAPGAYDINYLHRLMPQLADPGPAIDQVATITVEVVGVNGVSAIEQRTVILDGSLLTSR